MSKFITIKRVKTPTLFQHEALECGAACLGIILAYYKKFIPLAKLRLDCGVSRDGSNAFNIVKAAANYDLDPFCNILSLSQLPEHKAPFIVFWKFNHFVVVEGISKNKVYINDPATGPRIIPFSEFENNFTGVIVKLTPSKDFKPSGRPQNYKSEIFRWIKSFKLDMLFVILCGIGLILPNFIIPITSKIFIDNYLIQDMTYFLKPLLIGMTVILFIQISLRWLQRYFLLKFQMKLSLCKANQFFWKLLNLPISFFYQRQTGDLIFRANLTEGVCEHITQNILQLTIDSFTLLMVVLLLFLFNSELATLILLMGAINICILIFSARYKSHKYQQIINERSVMNGNLNSYLSSIQTIKATSRERDVISSMASIFARINNFSEQAVIFVNLLRAIPLTITAITIALIFSYGALLVIDGDITIGTLFAIQALAITFMMPLNKMIDGISQIQEVFAGIHKINDVIDHPNDESIRIVLEPKEISEAETWQPKLRGALSVQDISFGYSPLADPVLKSVSFTIKPGERVAIVGRSGCGKSTLAKLLTQLYQPWTGQILLDDKPLLEHDSSTILRSVAMVSQEIFLFKGSVRDNLTMWNDTVDDLALFNACKAACIHADISIRTDGYDSLVEEGGINFSGGQKQRLEIARALLVEPSILILDEATSNLDPILEQKIDSNIRKQGCSCVVIAHRLSTIRFSDRIIVIDDGQIVEVGTHETLMSTGKHYKYLVRELEH